MAHQTDVGCMKVVFEPFSDIVQNMYQGAFFWENNDLMHDCFITKYMSIARVFRKVKEYEIGIGH